jgi:hypothetical protein
MKSLYDKALARLLRTIAIVAAVPLAFVLVVKVFDGFENIFAAIGVLIVARFFLLRWREEGW